MRSFDSGLVGAKTPDWYLYLRADEDGFDALVTSDWHQSEQPEELWALSRTRLSIITWKHPVDDPIREWGQLLAYLPEIRRMIEEHGPSILFLPSPRLTKANLVKASEALGAIAGQLGLSNQELRDRARNVIVAELEEKDESGRFPRISS